MKIIFFSSKLLLKRETKFSILLQYLSKCNQTFKSRLKKYQTYLAQENNKSIVPDEEKNAFLLLSSQMKETKLESANKKIPSGKKLKKQLTTKLQKKQTKFLDDHKESFLITQSEVTNLPPKADTSVKTKPFLKLFEEKKLLREKIIDAIEFVKKEKKWFYV